MEILAHVFSSEIVVSERLPPLSISEHVDPVNKM